MINERAYCDHNATSPMRPPVRAIITAHLKAGYGNPSSPHREGRAAQSSLREARLKLCDELDCDEDELILVSGGSEANTTVINTFAQTTTANNTNRHHGTVVGSVGEHDSIRNHPAVKLSIRLKKNGRISLSSLQESITACSPRLVSCHGANNETGVIQPIEAIRKITKEQDIYFHADLSQYCGRMTFSFRKSNLDYATITAHKIGGPIGIAALLVRRGCPLLRVIHGGHQELEHRAGTENVALAHGFAVALEWAIKDQARWQRLARQIRRLESALKAEGPPIIVVGEQSPRLPNTLSWLTPGYRSETLLIRFDQAGVALSTGSACGAGVHDSPHTLLGMEFSPALARSALRASFGWNSKPDHFRKILDVWRTLT